MPESPDFEPRPLHDIDDEGRRLVAAILLDAIAALATKRQGGWRRTLIEIRKLSTSGTAEALLASPPTKRPAKEPVKKRDTARPRQRSIWPSKTDC